MTKSLIKTESYKVLVRKISQELSELDFFIKRRTAETYWKVGKFIHEHLLEHKDRAGYGQNIYDRLIKDVDRDKSTLQRCVQFYRTYPIVAVPRQLSWEHYKSLITVHDKSKREFFAKRAAEKEWTSQELEEAIRLDKLKIDEPEDKLGQRSVKLSVTRSRLFTYQILEPSYIHPIEEHLAIDLGFKFLIHTEVKVRHSQKANGETSPKSKIAKKDFGGGIRLKQGEIIESEKTGERYSFKHSDATPKELYTYKALVEKVVDADTIWLNIDVGFSCPPSKMARPRQNLKILAGWSRQKVRLRGIDSPEITTQKGQEAKKFAFEIVMCYNCIRF